MIIGVGCWRGVGATTTALLLAAALRADGANPWLIEADPAGGVLVARLGLSAQPMSGLESVAFPGQRRPPLEHFEIGAHVVCGVRIVAAPADPFRAHGCHTPRAPWPTALRELADPVVVDVGTIRAGSPVWPVLHELDVLLLTISTEVTSVVATDDWARALGRTSASDDSLADDITRLVVVDAPSSGVAFTRQVLQADLGDRLAGWLPWSSRAVDLVHRGAGLDDRRLRRDHTALAARQLVGDLAGEFAGAPRRARP